MTDDRELLKEPLATLRVGLVVSFLPIGINKSHLSVVAGFIETIACAYANFSVMLLITNDNNKFIKQGTAKRRKKIYTANLKKLIIEFLGTKIAENITVKIVDGESSAPNVKSITLIDEYRPDILFFWGGINNCRVLRRMAYKRYPVGFRFFNIKNLVDNNADIYITSQIDQQVRGPHDPTKCVYQPSVVKLYEDEHCYPFDHVKKSSDEFTITTVISGERLAEAVRGYTKERVDSFFHVFNLHKNVRWVFIGPNTPDEVIVIDSRFSELIKQGRIEIINREWHLRAFYRHCDLYVHLPDLVGGGGGVNMARAEGIATLCYTGSDACAAQWPGAIYSDDSSFFSAVSYYITNEPARDELGKTVREYMLANCSPEAVADKLKENISRAIENYNLRVGITDKASL